MLSENVLKIDVCRYLEENWPLDDGDLEKMHKLYRLVAYHRCSFGGKKAKTISCLCLFKHTRALCIAWWPLHIIFYVVLTLG